MRLPVLSLALCSITVVIGCSGSNESDTGSPTAEPAADISVPVVPDSADETGADRQLDDTLTSGSTLPAPKSRGPSNGEQADGGAVTESQPDFETEGNSETGLAVPTARLQLPPDLKPRELVQFLGKADRQMRELASTATSAVEYRQSVPELKRLANLKRTAAQRVIDQPSVSPELLRQAKRGRLQALSHLAAMDDLKAADELEEYAKELADSADPMLAVESRIVLLGFALERLQSGTTENPDHVVQLVSELAENREVLKMPALMATSQSRAVLEQYGYSKAAQEVRDQLLLAFADHPDPQLAAMAEQMAGTERFDRLDALRRALDQGETVTPAQWERAATDAARKQPDAMTLQYLATAALGFESEGDDALAEVTYQVMQRALSDSDDPELVEELNVILDSYAARQRIIGEPLQIDLPDLRGKPVDWSEYRGKIVLIPFWAAEYPDSIQIFPLLEQIRAADPNQIAILGVSLDINDASVSAFTSQMQPDWTSVRSRDAADRGAMSPLAKQVGLASMPYVVVVDRDGTVAAVSMSGSDLERIVAELLQDA